MSVTEMLGKMGMIEQLAAMMTQQEHAPFHEHLMRALLALVQHYTPGTRECRRPELQLRTFLESRMSYLEGREEYKVSVKVPSN